MHAAIAPQKIDPPEFPVQSCEVLADLPRFGHVGGHGNGPPLLEADAPRLVRALAPATYTVEARLGLGWTGFKLGRFADQDREDIELLESRIQVLEALEDTEAAQRAWAAHPEHIAAQKKGREQFYLEYRIQVCEVRRENSYPRKR